MWGAKSEAPAMATASTIRQWGGHGRHVGTGNLPTKEQAFHKIASRHVTAHAATSAARLSRQDSVITASGATREVRRCHAAQPVPPDAASALGVGLYSRALFVTPGWAPPGWAPPSWRSSALRQPSPAPKVRAWARASTRAAPSARKKVRQQVVCLHYMVSLSATTACRSLPQM